MLIRHLDMPEDLYYKMIEYLDTDEQREVHDFILDVLESYIDIQIEMKAELIENENYE
tara:strand:+ start:1854 stop:2027 length:174 start_codon:yes stop_codon:yes gene_type:complete